MFQNKLLQNICIYCHVPARHFNTIADSKSIAVKQEVRDRSINLMRWLFDLKKT